MKVYLLRHGQTDYNVKDLLNQNPRIKIPLNKTGVRQAEKVAKKFQNKKIDIIFSSDFLRTRQTTAIINKFHKVKIKVDKRLTEFKTGFEGEPVDNYRRVRDNPDTFKMKGKESWLDLKKRVNSFLQDLKKKNYKSVLIVTHGETIRAALGILKNLPNEKAHKIKVKNCQVFEFAT